MNSHAMYMEFEIINIILHLHINKLVLCVTTTATATVASAIYLYMYVLRAVYWYIVLIQTKMEENILKYMRFYWQWQCMFFRLLHNFMD